jgi:hypothetical protein
MSEVIPLAPLFEARSAQPRERGVLLIRTDSIYIVFTTIEETLAAVRVAAELGKAMAVPLTLVHFRAVPYPLSVEAPAGLSPVETNAFIDRLSDKGIEVRVRVYLCRNERRVIPFAFKSHCLIVIGGRHRWWPTAAERWRQRLEAAGHFVLLVDASGVSTRLEFDVDSLRGRRQELFHA